jgi:hypothetical protein
VHPSGPLVRFSRCKSHNFVPHRPNKLTYVPPSAELGVDADLSVINLVEGENFKPEYLKIVGRDSHLVLFRLIETIFSEPQCHPSRPHPQGKIIHYHRRRDQLSRVHLIGKGRP